MILKLWHGRLDPRNGGSDLDGNVVDDWGFDGPELNDVVELSMTYGNLYVVFDGEEATVRAKEITGWERGPHDYDLIVPINIPDGNDCVQVYNKERLRFEYFGDWWCH